jgi:hypothetical protein
VDEENDVPSVNQKIRVEFCKAGNRPFPGMSPLSTTLNAFRYSNRALKLDPASDESVAFV